MHTPVMKLLFSNPVCYLIVAATVVAQTADQNGQWGSLFEVGLTPIHSIVLRNGNVLSFHRYGYILYDPLGHTCYDSATNNWASPPCVPMLAPIDLYCTGHAALTDGRILFHDGGSGGSQITTIYDPGVQAPGAWNVLSEITPLRFYPTCTALGDGRILLLAGEYNSTAAQFMPAVFNPNAPLGGQWSFLSGARYCSWFGNLSEPINCSQAPDPNLNFYTYWYPFMFQHTDGKVLYAGENFAFVPPLPPVKTRRLNLTATGSWENVISGNEIPGCSAVLYRPDKIVKGGGSSFVAPSDQVVKLDATGTTPYVWQPIASLNHARTDFLLVVLPDGSVLAISGDDYLVANPLVPPELLSNPDDPASTWRLLAPPGPPRTAHSSAVLLPDGRVYAAGGLENQTIGHTTAQIFSPPYLFAPGGGPAARPVIDTVASACMADVLYYGKPFTVTTAQAGTVTAVNLIRPGAATHSFDQEQRFVPLSFSSGGSSTLNVTAPPNGNHAPPGYYMLFIVAGGVPSVAHWVHVKTLTADCNNNGKDDQCDIGDGTSQDCETSGVPDECEGGAHIARVVLHTPQDGHTLWRTHHNTMRHLFSCNVTTPVAGDFQVRELWPNGQFGPDLSASFAYTVEYTDDDMVKARRLRIRELDPPVLVHGKWYRFQNVGWDNVETFCLDYQVQKADATGDAYVNGDDHTAIQSGITTIWPVYGCLGIPGRDDSRLDINGDCKINAVDAGAFGGYEGSIPVEKPKYHPSCVPE